MLALGSDCGNGGVFARTARLRCLSAVSEWSAVRAIDLVTILVGVHSKKFRAWSLSFMSSDAVV